MTDEQQEKGSPAQESDDPTAAGTGPLPPDFSADAEGAFENGNVESPPNTMETELEAAQDRGLRLQAELENTRRRHQRELEDRRRYANIDLMRDLLPVLDNIDRAIEAAGGQADAADLLAGVQMVREQLISTLAQHHCARIEALGQPFDPNLHEAISQLASPEHAAGTVINVTQEGYQLHDRVVRPPQVIIAAADKSTREEPVDQSENPES